MTKAKTDRNKEIYEAYQKWCDMRDKAEEFGKKELFDKFGVSERRIYKIVEQFKTNT